MEKTLVQIGENIINFHPERKKDPFMVAIIHNKVTINIKPFRRLSSAINYIALRISNTDEDNQKHWR